MDPLHVLFRQIQTGTNPLLCPVKHHEVDIARRVPDESKFTRQGLEVFPPGDAIVDLRKKLRLLKPQHTLRK